MEQSLGHHPTLITLTSLSKAIFYILHPLLAYICLFFLQESEDSYHFCSEISLPLLIIVNTSGVVQALIQKFFKGVADKQKSQPRGAGVDLDFCKGESKNQVEVFMHGWVYCSMQSTL